MASNRVFVSSTCYDLIDVRTELEDALRGAGLSPILSDSTTSDFEVEPRRDSIDTCLVNVRACDVFVMVLSKRYGPSLKKVGYGDVSATHLEYRTAIAEGKPVWVYVRDRLQAAYEHWKAQGRPSAVASPWVAQTTRASSP